MAAADRRTESLRQTSASNAGATGAGFAGSDVRGGWRIAVAVRAILTAGRYAGLVIQGATKWIGGPFKMGKVRFAGRAALIAAALLLSACSSPDDYPIGLREASSRLNAVNIPPSGSGVFFQLETTVSGNSADEVTWTASGAHAAYACKIGLEKIDAGRTHVTVDCNGGSPSSGAAAGMAHNLIRNRVIEMVDATLTGRKFNPQLANGATAARWPGDGVDGSFASAAGSAIKMDADMRTIAREAEASERERERELMPERAEPVQSINPQDQPSDL